MTSAKTPFPNKKGHILRVQVDMDLGRYYSTQYTIQHTKVLALQVQAMFRARCLRTWSVVMRRTLEFALHPKGRHQVLCAGEYHGQSGMKDCFGHSV